MDLGSVNAPPPLDHRDSGVGWSGDTAILLQRVMPLAKILERLEAQASSRKLQAASS
tara:strand:+ start:389 stop:559 length:171 start_codon:yes stop_codon:yes gene_type:complete